jgi:hypothetical protein
MIGIENVCLAAPFRRERLKNWKTMSKQLWPHIETACNRTKLIFV